MFILTQTLAPSENTVDPSTPTFAHGLPSPVSSRKEAVSYPDIHSSLPSKRREAQLIDLAASDDPEDNPTLPFWTPRKKHKTSRAINTDEKDVSQAIWDILAPKPTVWGEDIKYFYSDKEDEPQSEPQSQTVEDEPPQNGDSDDSLTPPPDSPLIEPRESSPSLSPISQHRPNKSLPALDPGIIRTFNPQRRPILQFDPSQPRINRGTIFGHIPGLYVGKRWHSRMGAAWDGTHPFPVAGIAPAKDGKGAVAIVMNGGYEDDIDEGYRFIYSGSGGRASKRTGIEVVSRGGRASKGSGKIAQAKHQDWNRSNSALRENVRTERPVRVLRGYKGDQAWSPNEGFMYCGLYEVVACWVESGKSGFDVIRFAFKRLPNQDPLVNGKSERMAEPDYDGEEWQGWEARLTKERAEEVVALKKEGTPDPEHSTAEATISHPGIKTEEP